MFTGLFTTLQRRVFLRAHKRARYGSHWPRPSGASAHEREPFRPPLHATAAGGSGGGRRRAPRKPAGCARSRAHTPAPGLTADRETPAAPAAGRPREVGDRTQGSPAEASPRAQRGRCALRGRCGPSPHARRGHKEPTDTRQQCGAASAAQRTIPGPIWRGPSSLRRFPSFTRTGAVGLRPRARSVRAASFHLRSAKTSQSSLSYVDFNDL